ncbi:MAG: hypothetical protein ACLFTT_14040 [Candidatus Hydrogenedentota bacterium]
MPNGDLPAVLTQGKGSNRGQQRIRVLHHLGPGAGTCQQWCATIAGLVHERMQKAAAAAFPFVHDPFDAVTATAVLVFLPNPDVCAFPENKQ